jgi:hypothetical protein
MNKLLLILVVPLVMLIAYPVWGSSASGAAISQTDEAETDQTETCPILVQTAMDITSAECDGTGRNQACYGHILLEAQLQAGAETLDFSTPGSRVDVTRLQSLRLSPMEASENIWGIALMRLQANLPASQMEDVTLLVFGDVEIENAVGAPTMAEVSVTARAAVNVRRGPTTSAGVIATLQPGETVIALERLADSTWLRVELEDGVTGWVFGELLSPLETDALNIADAWTPYYRPMQAFYFRSGSEDSACPQEQTDGMLIQTPEGVGEITLLINEIDIQIGSTVFFQAQPGHDMTISVLQGYARVHANGVTHTAIAGTRVSVPLNENSTPAGPPTPPQPYDEPAIRTVPLTALTLPVIPPPALTEAEIEEHVASEAERTVPDLPPEQRDSPPGLENRPDCPGQSCEPPGQDGRPPGQGDDPPGQIRDPPGQSDNPPGQSGNPPGQSGDPPGQGGNPPGQSGNPPGQSGNPPGQGGNPPGQGGQTGGALLSLLSWLQRNLE